jgi:hypothetical protein
MNDTTREVGGALGIAVFGSIVNSLYRSSLDLGGLTAGLGRREIKDSVAARPTRSARRGRRRAVIERRQRVTHVRPDGDHLRATIAVRPP